MLISKIEELITAGHTLTLILKNGKEIDVDSINVGPKVSDLGRYSHTDSSGLKKIIYIPHSEISAFTFIKK